MHELCNSLKFAIFKCLKYQECFPSLMFILLVLCERTVSTIDTGDIPVAAALLKFHNNGENKHIQNNFQISNTVASVIMKTFSIFP